jgi:putative intracellular protease/amidase
MSSKAALYWDESFLWGIFAANALGRLGLDFELLSSEEIRGGRLDEFAAVVVPGGWASNKLKALGADGTRRMREFVFSGGAYFGLCGGAGLATMDGLGLINAKRRPLSERVPSLSGPVRVRLVPGALWEGVGEPVFHIWWPSQLVAGDGVSVLAEFERATSGAFSADVPVGDMADSGWELAEEAYGINLNPAKMSGSPLLLEGRFGEGKVIASLMHFDTPGDKNGEAVLKNLWTCFGLETVKPGHPGVSPPSGRLYEMTRELIDFGIRNSLWMERGPLINWRRGIRGLEYYTLYRLIAEIDVSDGSAAVSDDIEADIEEFVLTAKKLLELECEALRKGQPITFSSSPGPEIGSLRSRLFADGKRYGGFFKDIIDGLDSILFRRLKEVRSGNRQETSSLL